MLCVRSIKAGVLLAMLSAGSVETVAAQSAGGALSDRVQIELRGSVTPQCAFEGIAPSLDLGAVSGNGGAAQKALSFRISCNAPFGYSLSSQHGAMKNAAAAAGQGILADFPYTAALTITTDDGGMLRLTCASADLGQNSTLCQGQSGDATAIEKDAALTVSWGPLAGRLAAGSFSDDLRIGLSIAN